MKTEQEIRDIIANIESGIECAENRYHDLCNLLVETRISNIAMMIDQELRNILFEVRDAEQQLAAYYNVLGEEYIFKHR